MPGTLLIANPGSRSGDNDLDSAQAELSRLGPVSRHLPEDPTELPALIRRHAQSVDRVVLAGGDGTVNLALDALVEVKRPLGILPLGTANDLARSLGISEDLDQAVAVITAGHRRRIDIARANGESFVNAIGIGLGPQMTREMDSETKSRFGVAAYLIGLLRALKRTPQFRASVDIDGQRHQFRCLQITVASGIHYGGGMTIAEDARLDDGQLDVVVTRCQSRLALVANAARLRYGLVRSADQLSHFRCRQVRIESRPRMDFTADGEFVGHTPIDCELVPAALEVYAPESGESS